MELVDAFNKTYAKIQRGEEVANPTIETICSNKSIQSHQFLALTEKQGVMLLTKYSNDLELWDRFWQFMADQSDQGAPWQYVLDSYEAMEKAWQIRKGKIQ